MLSRETKHLSSPFVCVSCNDYQHYQYPCIIPSCYVAIAPHFFQNKNSIRFCFFRFQYSCKKILFEIKIQENFGFYLECFFFFFFSLRIHVFWSSKRSQPFQAVACLLLLSAGSTHELSTQSRFSRSEGGKMFSNCTRLKDDKLSNSLSCCIVRQLCVTIEWNPKRKKWRLKP